jgi:hypothetical protein
MKEASFVLPGRAPLRGFTGPCFWRNGQPAPDGFGVSVRFLCPIGRLESGAAHETSLTGSTEWDRFQRRKDALNLGGGQGRRTFR